WTLGFGLWTLDQRIPQSERCSDGAAGVAGRGGEIHFLEGRLQIDLSVSHRVHGAAASKSQIRTLIFLVKRIEQGEERLLVHGLSRAGEVLVPLFEWVALFPGRPEQLFQSRRVEDADFGGAIVPTVNHVVGVVTEEPKVQLIGAVG